MNLETELAEAVAKAAAPLIAARVHAELDCRVIGQKEAAKRLGISPRTLRGLPFRRVHVSGQPGYRADDVTKYIEEHTA